MDTRIEVMFENSLYHYRLVADGQVIFRGDDVATAALAITAANAAKATLTAAATVPTPGDIVSFVTSRALSQASTAPVINLIAGISDDKGGTG